MPEKLFSYLYTIFDAFYLNLVGNSLILFLEFLNVFFLKATYMCFQSFVTWHKISQKSLGINIGIVCSITLYISTPVNVSRSESRERL